MDALSGAAALGEAAVEGIKGDGLVSVLLALMLVVSWTVAVAVIRYLVRERNSLQAKLDQMSEDALVAARTSTSVIQSVNSGMQSVAAGLQSIESTLKAQKPPMEVFREAADFLERREARERTRG